MLGKLLNKLGATIYIQIWEDRIKLTEVTTGEVFDEKPFVAIESDTKGEKKIIAVGNVASLKAGKNIDVINPFSHPRVLLSDFTIGEKLLQHMFKKLLGNNIFTPAPVVVLQPMEKTEGGLATIEIRAFEELALGAGARDVIIYQGQSLSIHNFDYETIKSNNNLL